MLAKTLALALLKLAQIPTRRRRVKSLKERLPQILCLMSAMISALASSGHASHLERLQLRGV
jgi:hypothetical protein